MTFSNLLVFLAGFVTMFFGTATGGVGLVIVPLLMAIGLSPHVAVATTRFSIFAGDLIGLRVFQKGGKVDHALVLPVLLLGIAGSVFGSIALVWTPGPLVEKFLGAFLLLMLPTMLFHKNVGLRSVSAPSSVRKAAGFVLLFCISVIGSFFSVAAGLLGRTTLMTCFGQTYLQSAATRKIHALGAGIISVLVFAWSGIFDLPTVIVLTPAMILGSLLGSRFALRKGDTWVQVLFFIIVLVAGIKFLLF